jgi:uridine monophosphate synthetase
MSFFSELQIRSHQIESLLCVGLDPHPQDLAEPTPDALLRFCLRLIEATADQALAFKPNAAFFEAFGPEGIKVLQQVIAEVPSGTPVILDAKRGDIASTAEAYARAAFQNLGANAITLSPYLGRDSLEPFMKDPERGVFLLCKTSNPGAGDLQNLSLEQNGQPLYQKVAALAQSWDTRDNLGLVVGATYPEALGQVRAAAPKLWILAPGVGAQGGELADALQAGVREDGQGIIFPVSRALSRAADPRQAAINLRQEINQAREAVMKAAQSRTPQIASLQTHSMYDQTKPDISLVADGLLAAGCVKFGQFTLKSGLVSPIYLDLRRLAGYPNLLRQVARAYLPILNNLSFTRLAALPYAALPIGTAISLLNGSPLLYPRKETKEYGTKAEIEGGFSAGEGVVVIDDLATTGGSKFEAIDKLSAAGLQVEDIVVLIDRQSGAKEALAARGFRLHAVFNLGDLLDYWESTKKVPADQIEQTRRFIERSKPED